MLEDERLLFLVPGLGYFIASPAGTATGSDQQPPVVRVADLLHARREDRCGGHDWDGS
jgi:hypothetical protein